MILSPHIYHWLIRPKWLTKKHIHNHIENHLTLKKKYVLDFGSGTGANCSLCSPAHYYGTDPDHKRIEFAKRLYPRYQFTVLKDGEAYLPLEDHSIDIVLIIAVLHHIAPAQISRYIQDFKRILKHEGEILVIEPCFLPGTPLSNWFMKTNDKGDFIQYEGTYLKYFKEQGLNCQVLGRFNKGLFYNELFFCAHKQT